MCATNAKYATNPRFPSAGEQFGSLSFQSGIRGEPRLSFHTPNGGGGVQPHRSVISTSIEQPNLSNVAHNIETSPTPPPQHHEMACSQMDKALGFGKMAVIREDGGVFLVPFDILEKPKNHGSTPHRPTTNYSFPIEGQNLSILSGSLLFFSGFIPSVPVVQGLPSGTPLNSTGYYFFQGAVS